MVFASRPLLISDNRLPSPGQRCVRSHARRHHSVHRHSDRRLHHRSLCESCGCAHFTLCRGIKKCVLSPPRLLVTSTHGKCRSSVSVSQAYIFLVLQRSLSVLLTLHRTAACIPITLSAGIVRLRVVNLKDQKVRGAHEKSAQTACEAAAAIRTVASLTREEDASEAYSRSLGTSPGSSRATHTRTSLTREVPRQKFQRNPCVSPTASHCCPTSSSACLRL